MSVSRDGLRISTRQSRFDAQQIDARRQIFQCKLREDRGRGRRLTAESFALNTSSPLSAMTRTVTPISCGRRDVPFA